MSLTPEPVRRSQLFPGVTLAQVYAVVTDFAAYPRLFKEMKSVKVLSSAGNRQRVEFRLEMVVAVRYVLDLVGDPAANTVDWTYVEGEVVTGSQGGWRFTPEGNGTRVDYQAALTIKAPLPGFVIRRVTDALVSASLPAMFSSIEAEVNTRKRAAG